MQINEPGQPMGQRGRSGVVCWLGRVALLLSLVASVRADDFNLGSDQRDALTDKLLRSKGISYQPRRVENDRRLWAYPEYATQRRTQSYMIQAFKQDCLEQNAGRY